MPQPQTASVQQPIRRLPSHLANQIAAGEVVERPASIVKELIENSLDAGAQRINVTLKQGGLQLVSVQDDGLGIPAEELPLALAPHATSKISRVEDLVAITSMGFRGEALASMGSVARLQITSCSVGAERGWTVSGPEPKDKPVPAAHPQGTTVTVQELFFNTPARRRFLRSERTEFRHCEDVVRRMALSRFDVEFVLQHNQRRIFKLPIADTSAAQEQRIARLCGPSFMQQAVGLEFQHGDMHLRGWIGLPESARPQADLQYFFVNGRIIRDRVISHALRQAYADRLHPGRHPAYVLYLTLNPSEVDVNVHPTKHEVRFHQGRLVHDFLVRCVNEALDQQDDSPALPYAREPLDWHTPAPGNVPVSDSHSKPATDVSHLAELTPDYAVSPANDVISPFGPVVTVLQNRYAVCEQPAGVILIDIEQLQAEVLLQQFHRQQADDGIACRPLLIPLTINLDTETAWVEEKQQDFEQLGFDLSVTGEHSILLRRTPILLEYIDFTHLLPAWFAEVAELSSSNPDMLLPSLARLAPRFRIEPWTALDINPLLGRLAEQAKPLMHPAVALLDQAALASLFRS
jgi:DNA mismatch repair protein MutL